MSVADTEVARRLARVGALVLERGWLSSNNILFVPADGGPGTLVDSGYVLHADQTEALVRARLGRRSLARVVNTHLHSDHCGGNARLQAAFDCEIWVPDASVDAVRDWDSARLTFARTDQQCERFRAQGAVEPNSTVVLGDREWMALATPGHDPDALVFYEPDNEVLIAGDALWHDRLAIVFPELAGEDGFSGVRHTLNTIERLRPRLVIPGHGAPFTDVEAALATSRHRLESFERMPERHLAYALRALVMFHMLEQRQRSFEDVAEWMGRTPILRQAMRTAGLSDADVPARVDDTLQRLIRDGALIRHGDQLRTAGDRRA